MWLRNRSRRFWRRSLWVVLAGALFLSVGALMVDRFGHGRAPIPTAPAIVVLGARVLDGGVPSGALRARIEEGIALYHAGKAPLLVFSGGLGDHAPSEAEVGLRLAVQAGVPQSACILEDQSHSTFENARFTARLLRERGIGEVILVTDPYHLLRARQHFWAEGFTVHLAPARMTDRNIRAVDRAWWTVREVLALVRRPQLLLVRRPPR